MISYLKKLLKQNDSVKIHLIDGSVISALHFKKGYSNGNCLVIDEDNVEHYLSSRYIVQIES